MYVCILQYVLVYFSKTTVNVETKSFLVYTCNLCLISYWCLTMEAMALLVISISVCFLPNTWASPSLHASVGTACAVGPEWTALTTGPSYGPPLSGCWLTGCAIWHQLRWTSPSEWELTQYWVHTTDKGLHTCMFEHWRQLLWKSLFLSLLDSWNNLLVLNRPGGMEQFGVLPWVETPSLSTVVSLYDWIVLRDCMFILIYQLA